MVLREVAIVLLVVAIVGLVIVPIVAPQIARIYLPFLPPQVQGGTIIIQFVDPPRYSSDIKAITITVSDFAFHSIASQYGESWISVKTEPVTIDLLQIIGIPKMVSTGVLPPGQYNIIRFQVSGATVTISDYSGSRTFALSVPAGHIQVTILNGGFTITQGVTRTVQVDIYADNTKLHSSQFVPALTATVVP